MNVAYQLNQYDKRHRLLKEHSPQQSRSFVKAFLQLLYCQTSNLTQNVVDITNTSRSFATTPEKSAWSDVCHPGLDSADNCVYLIGGGSSAGYPPRTDCGADEKGIVVGTSSTAVAVADDNLVAPIAHGSSAGQFVHYGCWGLNYTTGASSASFDVERIFRNDSGGSIVVAEIGMYAGSMVSLLTFLELSFCILRDVLGATVTVLNGEYLKVKYTITVSN